METEIGAPTMLHKSRRSPKLLAGFDITAFACILAVVILAIMIAKSVSDGVHSPVAVDPPWEGHAVSMASALREDAITVRVADGGQVWLGGDWLDADSLPLKIAYRLKDPNVERTVYIVADKKAPLGSVKVVLECVRSAGITRVVFLVNRWKN